MSARNTSITRDWELTPNKYLNDVEIGQMLRTADDLWTLGEAKQRKGLVRDAMLVFPALVRSDAGVPRFAERRRYLTFCTVSVPPTRDFDRTTNMICFPVHS